MRAHLLVIAVLMYVVWATSPAFAELVGPETEVISRELLLSYENALPHATSYCNGSNYISVVRLSDLTNAPVWDSEGAPPISPRQAEDLARRALEKQFGPEPKTSENIDLVGWGSGGVALRRFFITNKWFYEIQMHPKVGGTYKSAPVTVFINMAGVVVPFRFTSVATDEDKVRLQGIILPPTKQTEPYRLDK